LITEKPSCFDVPKNGMRKLLKTPFDDRKIDEGGLRLQGYFKISSEGKPLITIVTVVYNGAEYLEKTIKSVIEQDYENIEYIIVDGGSKDGTLDIIRRYEHAIDYWVSEPDKGIYDAMNKGIDLGGGGWIGILNSDDFYADNAISIVAKAASGCVDVICGAMEVVTRDDCEYIELRVPKPRKLPFGMYVNHPSSFVSAKLYNDFMKYDSGLKMAADYKFFLSVFLAGYRFVSVNSSLAVMRDGGASITDYTITRDEESFVRKSVLPAYLYRAVVVIKKFKNALR